MHPRIRITSSLGEPDSRLRCVEPVLWTGSHPSFRLRRTCVGLRPMAEKEGLVCFANRCAITLRVPHLRYAASNPSFGLVLIPHSGCAGPCLGLRPMAEKEGFEPPVAFPRQLISSQSHSATLPLLHTKGRGWKPPPRKNQLYFSVEAD